MSLTQFWECDGCGYRTTEPPNTGTFIRYSVDVDVHGGKLVPMMQVVYINPIGEAEENKHVCENCFNFGIGIEKGDSQ